MSTTSKPAPKTGRKTTRKHVVDGRYAALLAEDFGLDWAVVVEALITEPCKQAMKICAWAERTDEPAKALLAWSRKHQKGTHRPAFQPSRSPEEGHGGGTGNTPAGPDTRATSHRDESLRGILADPERLAQTAEKLGV